MAVLMRTPARQRNVKRNSPPHSPTQYISGGYHEPLDQGNITGAERHGMGFLRNKPRQLNIRKTAHICYYCQYGVAQGIGSCGGDRAYHTLQLVSQSVRQSLRLILDVLIRIMTLCINSTSRYARLHMTIRECHIQRPNHKPRKLQCL